MLRDVNKNVRFPKLYPIVKLIKRYVNVILTELAMSAL